MSQNQPSIQLPQSPEQQLSQADYLNSLPPKLHLILQTLSIQFLQLQQKYCSSYKKLQKQLQEKDRLILSLTKINSTLMRENARMKKKSDAQFQYFVKRIAETQCQAIKEKRALEDALLMCQGVIGRLGGEERGRESGQGGQGERDKNMVVAECKISSEEIQDRINSVKDLNIQLMNLPSTPKSPKKSPKPHLKASTTAREPASTKKQNLSDQKQRGGVNSLFIYTNPQKEEPRFSGNRPKRQLAIEVQI